MTEARTPAVRGMVARRRTAAHNAPVPYPPASRGGGGHGPGHADEGRPEVIERAVDPISNTDRLVLILRQKLLERSKAASRSRAGGKPAAGRPPAGSLDSVHALASVDGVDDRQLRRALIQAILADQFGGELINEAKFQQVVDRVAETIAGDAESAKLLSRVIGDLRDAGP